MLTAVEDFVAVRRGAAARHRAGVLRVRRRSGTGTRPGRPTWPQILEPYDRHPLLARLEANRVLHIAQEHALRVALWKAQERQTRQELLLRRLLESSAFGVAERLSKLRVRAGVAPGQSVISRDEIRRALED